MIHIPVTSLASGLQLDDKLTRAPSYLQRKRKRKRGGREMSKEGLQRWREEGRKCQHVAALFINIPNAFFLSAVCPSCHFFPPTRPPSPSPSKPVVLSLHSKLHSLYFFVPSFSAGHKDSLKGKSTVNGRHGNLIEMQILALTIKILMDQIFNSPNSLSVSTNLAFSMSNKV